jgi:DNA-binding NtrC family response regulator
MLDVLVADDDPDVRESVVVALRYAGHRVTEATDGAEAASCLSGHAFDLAICDVFMPRLDGHTLLRRIRRESPQTSVVMMTTFATVSGVVGSLRDGAVNYVTKPFDVDDFIAEVVAPLAERLSLSGRPEGPPAPGASRNVAPSLVVASAPMSRLAGRIAMIASSDAAVLLTGAQGVGKGLVARAIHDRGVRRDGPFVVVDGAGLQARMDASSLRRLADPGGVRDAWFRAASEGTLVVDGVERLPLRAQAELLRLLDEPATRPMRGPSWEPRGVRVVTVADEPLAGAVASGAFLDSLYYRLNAIHLRVPTLRERAGDLSLLVVALLHELVPPGAAVPEVSAEAWAALAQHEFVGNVRELRWALERALSRAHGGVIDVTHLPAEVARERC